MNGENYLAAIDTNFDNEGGCKYKSIALNYVLDIFEKSKISTKIVILDACRNNPFERKWSGRGVVVTGLAPVYAPKGTFIAYATSPGQIALDGSDGNGAFTSSLLNHIDTQGIRVEELFKRVRVTLSSTTNNKQISWEHTSLMGDFYFNNGYVDGQFLISYSEKALSDSDYIFNTESKLKDVIIDLRSHDWYIQNPAISKISLIDFTVSKKDEIFLLGRNIYQAACGNSSYAVDWIKQLVIKLNTFDNEISFHILNGIIYEIYFDSKGKLRNSFKDTYFDEVIELANKPEYENSCEFIRNHLEQYKQRIVYIPGSKQSICADVIVNNNDDNQYYVERICIEGQDVLYIVDKSELYDYNSSNWYTRQLPLKLFEESLRKVLVAPRGLFTINYTNNKDNTHLLVPLDFTLLRFSL
ncbi:caspase family protein [Clostridium estertheticum]|nr:caspase family protein [Clostridium estertheticum]MBU3162627.1 caspase family protein [Clostridium estertheticum]